MRTIMLAKYMRRSLWRTVAHRWCALQPDPNLVAVPSGVSSVVVYRNVVTEQEENKLWDELSYVLKEGETFYSPLGGGSTLEEQCPRCTQVELYGFKPYTEVKNWRKRETVKVPGLVWSPTLQTVLEGLVNDLLGCTADMAKVVEHVEPGVDMHTEHPSFGSRFALLNLLSDTVLELDDEATSRKGQVLLPQRSLAVFSGEIRWGWRFGEHPRDTHAFTSCNIRKRVQPDLRLSVQCWSFNPRMADHRKLQEMVSTALTQIEQHQEGPRLMKDTRERVSEGKLGGHLYSDEGKDRRRSQEQLNVEAQILKSKQSNLVKLLDTVKERENKGQSVSEEWMRSQLPELQQKDEYGYDPDNQSHHVELLEEKARKYRDKMKGMDYFCSSSENPDDSSSIDIKVATKKLTELLPKESLNALPEGVTRK